MFIYVEKKFVLKKLKIKKNGELFAMKKIEIEGEETIKKDTMVFYIILKKKLMSLLQLKNERILQHYEFFISKNIIREESFTYLCIIMDLCNAGSLKNLMKSFDFGEADILRWTQQISGNF
jgi:serine/threonine protein kinase